MLFPGRFITGGRKRKIGGWSSRSRRQRYDMKRADICDALADTATILLPLRDDDLIVVEFGAGARLRRREQHDRRFVSIVEVIGHFGDHGPAVGDSAAMFPAPLRCSSRKVRGVALLAAALAVDCAFIIFRAARVVSVAFWANFYRILGQGRHGEERLADGRTADGRTAALLLVQQRIDQLGPLVDVQFRVEELQQSLRLICGDDQHVGVTKRWRGPLRSVPTC